jgi:hypothetical protein
MERELAFSYYIGDAGIGPEVLDSFYYNFDSTDLKKYPDLDKIIKYVRDRTAHQSITNPRVGSYPIEIQFIVMKSYQYDCTRIFEMANYALSDSVVKQMIELIKKQIKLGMYCYDVKPGNFVANILNNNKADVKMIDFGADFCTEKQIYARHKNTEINPDLGVSYIDVLYISNIIQLYITYAIITRYVTHREVVRTFFSDPIFKKFFASDWKTFLINYISDSNMNDINGIRDPSTQFVYYCNMDNWTDLSKYTFALNTTVSLLLYAHAVLFSPYKDIVDRIDYIKWELEDEYGLESV